MIPNGELWFVTTTDRGSNEVAARGIVQSYLATHLGLVPVFYCASDCFEHASHLITLGTMTLIDEELKSLGKPWRYFSSLAVFSHTIRGLAKRTYHEWCSQHGPRSANQFVHKLFPRCDSGRWNSTDDTERRILACTKQMLEPVLRTVLSQAISHDACGPASATVWSGSERTSRSVDPAQSAPPTKKRRGSGSVSTASEQPIIPDARATDDAEAEAVDGVNGLSLQESKSYSRKVGKYRRSALTCCGDNLWWRLIQVMNCVKQPTVHLSSFLKKSFDKRTVTLCGNALTQLVHYKAQDFMTECEALIESRELVSACLSPELPETDRIFGSSLAVYLAARAEGVRHSVFRESLSSDDAVPVLT